MLKRIERQDTKILRMAQTGNFSIRLKLLQEEQLKLKQKGFHVEPLETFSKGPVPCIISWADAYEYSGIPLNVSLYILGTCEQNLFPRVDNMAEKMFIIAAKNSDE